MNSREINSAHTAVYRSGIREKANKCSMASVQSESFQGSRCKTTAGAATMTRTMASSAPSIALGASLPPCCDSQINNFQKVYARSTMVTRMREIICSGDVTEHINDGAHPQHPPQHQHQHHLCQRRSKGEPFTLPNHHQHHHQNHRQENRQNEDDDDDDDDNDDDNNDHLVVSYRHHSHHRSQQPQHPQEQHHLLDKCEKIKTRGICDLSDLRRLTVCDKFVNNASETYSIRRHRYDTVSNKFYPTASRILVRLRRSRLLPHRGMNIRRRDLFLHTVVSMLIIHLFTFSTLVSGLTHASSSSNSGNQTFHLAAMAASLTSSTSSASSSSSSSPSALSSSTTTTIVSNSGNTPSASSSSSSSSSTGDSTMPVGIGSFISRENTIRREPNLSYTTGGCHSCRMREQVKADNLASIKRHILLRLELKTLPNITSPIVPREIIEKFYKTHNVANRSSTGVGQNGGKDSSILNSGGGNNKHPSIPAAAASSYDNMQGDDPRIYVDYPQNSEENESEDYEEEFFSVVNSLYVFPTIPRMRHNRKPDILHFSFTNNGHSSVSQAILHVYIRGRDWIRDYDTSDFEISNNRHEIIFTINRVLRRQNSPNSTHTQKVNEVRQQIPTGIGNWINVDVTEMVTNWFNNPNTNHGLVIKTTEPWMKQLVITDDSLSNKAYALYIEIQTKDNRKRRTKRNTSLNCSEKDNEERCCRYPLEVDFRKFDWDWIVAPTSFNAYFCNGECQLAFLPKYPHTHLMQLSTAPQPCCSPTKMSPLKLLYFNNDRNLVMSTIPNMAVDKCSCS